MGEIKSSRIKDIKRSNTAFSRISDLVIGVPLRLISGKPDHSTIPWFNIRY